MFNDITSISIVFLLITLIVSYFLGNISPAIIIGKLNGIDIRKEGSGNAGTTNVLRVLGKKAAVATLVIDILKGVLAVILGRLIGSYYLMPEQAMSFTMACGFAAFVGHIWPLVFKFKGGKGVATAIGIILTVDYKMGLIVAAIALAIMAITRRVSAGSVIGAISLPIVSFFINPAYTFWSAVMAAVVVVKHRANIVRLLKGEEPKFSLKK